MVGVVESSTTLSQAIEYGSFPDSVDLLTSELTQTTIPSLLKTITASKEELSNDIRLASTDDLSDVDNWIIQAKKVQADIARCKDEARKIIEHHEQIEVLRNTTTDAASKVELLNSEITFTEALEKELQQISAANIHLNRIEELLNKEEFIEAAKVVRSNREQISEIEGPRARSLLSAGNESLRRATLVQLEKSLSTYITIEREQHTAWLSIQNFAKGTVGVEPVLDALDLLDACQPVCENVADKVAGFVYRAIQKRSQTRMRSYALAPTRITIELSTDRPSTEKIFDFVKDLLNFIHSAIPLTLETVIAQRLSPTLTHCLVNEWLNPAVPFELNELDMLDYLHGKASEIADVMKSLSWPGHSDLEEWAQQLPRTWLTKRKAETLDSVRKAFESSSGTMHQVERVERQTVSTVKENDEIVDDWNANWDDEKKIGGAKQKEDEEDTSGWGFEDEDNSSPSTKHHNGHTNEVQDDDAGDAWGWGDDATNEVAEIEPSKAVNGANNNANATREMTLTEIYNVTDIPDHLIEIIGKDIQDALTLQDGHHASLDHVPASSGLLALPTLALAMFRATAPTKYSNSNSLGNMNLYNDSLYIVEKLHNTAAPPGMHNLESDCRAMEKFARSAYAKEMEIQRTILNDLLDGAQGFTNCTQFPYSQEIENAVSATVDRIRQVFQEWKPILSVSALLQSIGSLVSMVISKTIVDIEELEDISEAQSKKLTELCGQISALENLFVSRPPGSGQQAEESVSMTAVYVQNWLRFQYLINILESSLVDIKFLWTEGELSLEFSADEVVELIKAIFAESTHRRSAISAIKGHRGSGP